MDLAIQNFRGIRKVNPVVDTVGQAIISAAACRNVELRYTEKANNVGIFTVDGNRVVASCPHKVVDQWESVQNRVSYHFVYAVDDTQGYLYLYKQDDGSFSELKSGLSVTSTANGITIANGFYDWFVFTNGVDPYVAINMQQELESERVKEIDATDAEGRTIRGLCLEAYDGRLVTNCQNRIHWSKTSDIFTWNTSDPNLTTEPAYQELDRDVTAIAYLKEVYDYHNKKGKKPYKTIVSDMRKDLQNNLYGSNITDMYSNILCEVLLDDKRTENMRKSGIR